MSSGAAAKANARARVDLDIEFIRLRRFKNPKVRIVTCDTLARKLNQAHRSRGFTPGRVGALLRERGDVRRIIDGVWEVLPNARRN